MKMKKSLFWVVMMIGLMTTSFTSCIERDADEDNKTYNTRAELIGIGWWDLEEVQQNGYRNDLHTLMLNFKKSRNVTVRITLGNDAYKDVEAQYTVSGNDVVAKIDGQDYFLMKVISIKDNELKCHISFVREHKSFDIKMKGVFAF
jgi:hypothetical protein